MEELINEIVELVLSNNLDNINSYIERLRDIPNEHTKDIMKEIELQMFHKYGETQMNSNTIHPKIIKVYESFFDKNSTTPQKERTNIENKRLSSIRKHIKSTNVAPSNDESFLENPIKNIRDVFKNTFTKYFPTETNDITSENILRLYGNVKDKFGILCDEWASSKSGQIETELKNNATGDIDRGGNNNQNNKDKSTTPNPSISKNPGQHNLRMIDNINNSSLICHGCGSALINQLKRQSKYRLSPYHFRRLPQIPILRYPIENRTEQKTMQFLNPYPVFANPYTQVAYIEVLRQALTAGIYYEFTDCRTILPSQITYPTPNTTSNLIGLC